VSDARDIVVIGGSAGAIEALTDLVGRLPNDLGAAFFVVIHTFPLGDSLLPEILSRRSKMVARVAVEGEPIACDRIYVAPPDCHLLLEPGRIRLSSGPKESGHRPAIDPLFRSAALAYGERVVAIVLSGTLDDGSTGLRVVRRHGGTAIVQDPAEALFGQMPRNAMASAQPQHVAGIAEIARLIEGHVRSTSTEGGDEGMSRKEVEKVSPNGDEAPVGARDAPGDPTGIACPECHGVLWAATDDESPDFRCRVGHTFSAESLLAAQSSSVEAALWAGLRALEEQASLAHHLASKAERRGDLHSAARFRERAEDAAQHASQMEAVLLSRTPKTARSEFGG
jgi:two-component system chemotaxis response regulator CheB